GTTVDYGCFAPVQAFVEVFKEFGINPTMDETRKPMGMLKRDHIKTMMDMPRINQLFKEKYDRDYTESDIDAMYRSFESKLMGILDQFADPKPFTLDVVAELRTMGIKIGSTTGYTDKMMAVVTRVAKEKGYEPDCWFSPDAVQNYGRPYPFMIYKNMEALGVHSVQNVIKIGDTVSDILEGKNAGILSIGVVEGSSELALTQAEFNALTADQKAAAINKVTRTYKEAGADYVILNLNEVIPLIKTINSL
ncbi:MAG: phosphonoacetaldehyde hydrolase, partial [Eubacterium sp.]